ncbi:hypothetical protein SAMN00808754_1396 [Thermanaeromonas toyohensis ToBE]|uniref:Uncharacterized protein n=1 Tax=Thermanaeromonas toyohensis ToBE TaxID=698762 RepID=A0A1W1VRU3_9FIRM|nr:hypothetical protein [Thermanaeromonas toyohensis]SMB96077.1 hypothetical protein SAMN00808754_1396 [Thermanaeromonas toyohensis ToBE]
MNKFDAASLKPVREVFIKYRTLSPVIQTYPSDSQGEQGTVYGRTMPVFVRKDDGNGYERVDLPVVSGSGVRCPARSAFVRAVLARLGYVKDGRVEIPGENGFALAETLIKGGRNTAGEKPLDLSHEDLRKVYTELPFFGMFGSFQVPGCLGVSFAVPLVERGLLGLPKNHSFAGDAIPADGLKEHREFSGVYTEVEGVAGDEGASIERFIAFCSELNKGLGDAVETDFNDTPPGEQKARTAQFKEFMYGLSRVNLSSFDDLASKLAARLNVKFDKDTVDAKIGALANKISGLMRRQNIYKVVHFIPAGTPLLCKIYLLPNPGEDRMEECFDAYVEFVLARPTLGGMAGRGFGLVEAEARFADNTTFEERSRAQNFWTWVDQNAESIRTNLEWLREKLVTPGRTKKK